MLTRYLCVDGGNRAYIPNQEQDTYSSELLSLSLTDSWDASDPLLETISNTSSPEVALGALWSSTDGATLYAWGGSSSDSPDRDAYDPKLWTFDVKAEEWTETEATADAGVAEGAVGVIPSSKSSQEPKGIVAFGHIDHYTTPGWSLDTHRVYLNSILTVDLADASFSNSTNFPSSSAFRPHADGTVTYVPGLGHANAGILVAIGGGTGEDMVPLDQLGVYHIGNDSWIAVSATGMSLRIESITALSEVQQQLGMSGSQIFMWVSAGLNCPSHQALKDYLLSYGGQNQKLSKQYDDLYALLLPDFVWVKMDADTPSVRAGHACTLVGSQLIVIGGWKSEDLGVGESSSPISLLDVQSMQSAKSYDADATTYRTPNQLSDQLGGNGEGTSDGSEACQPQYGSGSDYGHGDVPNSVGGAVASSSPSKVTLTDSEGRPTATTTSSGGGELQDGDQSQTSVLAVVIVVCVLAVLGMAAAAYFFIRKKRRQASFAKHQRLGSVEDLQDDPSILEEAPDQPQEVRGADNHPASIAPVQAYPPPLLQVQPSRATTILHQPTPQRPTLGGLRFRSSSSSLQSKSQGSARSGSVSRGPTPSSSLMNISASHSHQYPADSMGSLGHYDSQETAEGHRRLLPRQRLHVTNEQDEHSSSSSDSDDSTV